MDFSTTVAWAEAFLEDENAPLSLRLFSMVLLATEPVQQFIAEREAQAESAETE